MGEGLDPKVKKVITAAIEAFKEAAPFPNPPAGIVESDGTIKIRWDFVLEARSIEMFNPYDNFAKANDDENDPPRGL